MREQVARNNGKLATACSTCASGVSVVCMTSMGAALTAAGASAGASAASIASVHGSMGHTAGTSSVFVAVAGFFDRIGLDVLNNIPNAVAQPLLVVVLAIAVVTAYLAYRGHRRPHALALILVSSAALYAGIYVWMSDALYFLGFGGSLAAGAWGILLSRKVPARGSGGPVKSLA